MKTGASNQFQFHFRPPAGAALRCGHRTPQNTTPSPSASLFFDSTGIGPLSHRYRAAWRQGLKTTYYLRTKSASNIEKATSEVEKEKRGIVGTHAASAAAAKQYTAEEKLACSLEARLRGEECEACQ